MRWCIIAALPFFAGFGTAPGSSLPIEIGVLSCTMGQPAEAPAADQIPSEGQGRQLLCSFQLAKNGPEETYTGVLNSISAGGAPLESTALLWMIRAPVGTKLVAGLLEQRFAADQTTPRGQTALLVGDENSAITLHAMADPEEGSASKELWTPPRFAVTGIALKLRSSTT